MSYIAIDPGQFKSGFVRFLKGELVECGHWENGMVLSTIHAEDIVIVEWTVNYGRIIGESTLRTAFMCGMAKDRCKSKYAAYHEMNRKQVCRALVGKHEKKPVVNRAVLDLYPQTGGGAEPAIGTKNEPGPLRKLRELPKGQSIHVKDALALFEAWKQVQI